MRRRVTRVVEGWEPTAAQLRAVLLAGAAALMAVVARRPDLAVIAAPLVVVALWGHLTRPRGRLVASAELGETTLREGQTVPLLVRLEADPGGAAGLAGAAATAGPSRTEPDAGVDRLDAVATLASKQWVERNPASGVAWLTDGRAVLGLRSTRWGGRTAGTVAVAASSPWGAYRVGPVDLPELRTTTLPVPAAFDANAPTPHPRGIVGLNRSARPGSGSEFNTIRPFHPGDRLRRIHWPVSLRTGTLHVTSTYADEDAHVFLLVDAFSDLGPREGIDGRPTSLDTTVRAGGAIAEHFLQSNDRLTLRAVGAADLPPLGVGSGTSHLRRVLELLAAISPATERRDDGERAIRGIDPRALALVLSPLVEPRMVELAHRLAARGLTTVVIDTFPEHLVDNATDVYQSLAWRVRLLAREAQVHGLVARGVPVVPWHGPGSLDHVLRDIARRAAAPRRVRR